jgi:hypothetical protein
MPVRLSVRDGGAQKRVVPWRLRLSPPHHRVPAKSGNVVELQSEAHFKNIQRKQRPS